MEIVKKAVYVIYAAIFIFLAAGTLLAIFNQTSNDNIATLVRQMVASIFEGGPISRVLFLLAAAFFLFIGLSFLYKAVSRRDRYQVINVKHPNGEMAVRIAALEDHLATCKEEIPEVKELKPFLRMGKKGVQLDAKVVIWAEGNLPKIAMRTQEVLAAALKEALSLDDDIKPRIRVIVSKILKRRDGPPGGEITIKKKSMD